MNWANLKESKCPRCDGILKERLLYKCINCSFSISKGKLYNYLKSKPKSLEQQANTLLKQASI